MLFVLFRIAEVLLNILWWIIVIQAILSWLIAFNIINTWNDTVRSIWNALKKMTDPIYNPIRRIMPDFGGIDLTPMVVLILLIIIRGPVMTYLVQVGINAGLV